MAADGETACARAIELQLRGDLDAARQAYAAILASEPRHPAASYCLGMLHLQSGRPADALPLLHVALQAGPGVADYWLGYLEALRVAGQFPAARRMLELGRTQALAGARAQADEFAARLGAAEARKAEGEEGAAAAQEAQLLALVARGKAAEARALAIELIGKYPARGCAWNVLGTLVWGDGNNPDAEGVLAQAVKLMPENPEARCNLGLVLAGLERFDEAEVQLRRACALPPPSAHRYYALGMALGHQAKAAEAEAAFRSGLALRASATLAGEDASQYSNLLFAMAHDPDVGPDALFAEHQRFGQALARPPRRTRRAADVKQDPARPLNIGFVSGDFNAHPVGQFLEPVVRRLATRGDLSLFAYSVNPAADATTARLRSLFRRWTDASGVGAADLAGRISGDRVDILIDLSGHTQFNRLPAFAQRPAPVQASWLGYPGTTGLDTMDYYLADARWLPPGRYDGQFTERLVHLPDRWAYELPRDVPPVGALPALAAGHVCFASFHRLSKLNGATLRLWSRILHAVPGATLRLVSIPATAQPRIAAEFAAQGIAAGRLVFAARQSLSGYFALHQQVDIALDTLGYAGGTTTMHALAMGVPTLTIAGATPQARAGAGILAGAGLDAWIATDATDCVARAADWSQRLAELAVLRAALRQRLLDSPAGQSDLIAAHVALALRHMWRHWCVAAEPRSFATSALV